jgi:hypothetical protein
MIIVKDKSISEINIYGDSKMVVDWIMVAKAQRSIDL